MHLLAVGGKKKGLGSAYLKVLSTFVGVPGAVLGVNPHLMILAHYYLYHHITGLANYSQPM